MWSWWGIKAAENSESENTQDSTRHCRFGVYVTAWPTQWYNHNGSDRLSLTVITQLPLCMREAKDLGTRLGISLYKAIYACQIHRRYPRTIYIRRFFHIRSHDSTQLIPPPPRARTTLTGVWMTDQIVRHVESFKRYPPPESWWIAATLSPLICLVMSNITYSMTVM